MFGLEETCHLWRVILTKIFTALQTFKKCLLNLLYWIQITDHVKIAFWELEVKIYKTQSRNLLNIFVKKKDLRDRKNWSKINRKNMSLINGAKNPRIKGSILLLLQKYFCFRFSTIVKNKFCIYIIFCCQYKKTYLPVLPLKYFTWTFLSHKTASMKKKHLKCLKCKCIKNNEFLLIFFE